MKRSMTALFVVLALAAAFESHAYIDIPLECRLVMDVESVEVTRDKLIDGVVVVAHGFAGAHAARWTTLKLAGPVTDTATLDFMTCTRVGAAQTSLVGPVEAYFSYNVPPFPRKIVVRATTNSVIVDVPEEQTTKN